MALFTDNNKYAAEVIDVHPDLKYTVKFYDGIVKKNIPESSLDKFTEKASREAQLKAEELYGAKLNKPESPILDRSERRRSISRPRSGTDYITFFSPRQNNTFINRLKETDSTRSGRSTPEPKIIGRRSRSTTPVPPKSAKPTPKSAKSTPKTSVHSNLASTKATVNAEEVVSDSAKPKETASKRKSSRIGPLKRNATPEPDVTTTPKVIKQNTEIESIPKPTDNTQTETPSRPRGRLSRTLKIPTATTPKSVEPKKVEKKVKDVSKKPVESKNAISRPRRGQSGSLAESKPTEMSFDFEDDPSDTVQITKDSENKESLSSLVGPSGIDKWVEVRYLDDWITAKIIEPTTPKAKNQKPKGDVIYVHYKGWNKSFDSWVNVVPEVVRIPKEPKKEPKLEWNIGTKLLGQWHTNQFYPCEVIGHSGSCYQVLFYDGFKKRLPASELKGGTEEEFENALRLDLSSK